jgi:AcrR family transcriptional regulator
MVQGSNEGAPHLPGRPRDAAKGDSILTATVALLAEVGYAGLSIEAVAHRAGVSRPTIYRRYQNKVDLVIDVISAIAAGDASRFEGIAPRPPGRGSLAEDLEELLLTLASSFDAFVENGIVPGFLADLISHPDLSKRFFTEYLDVAQQNVRSVFRAAIERGEIRDEPLPEAVISMLVGAYIYHRFVIVQEFGAEERRIVANVIAQGLAVEQPHSPASTA